MIFRGPVERPETWFRWREEIASIPRDLPLYCNLFFSTLLLFFALNWTKPSFTPALLTVSLPLCVVLTFAMLRKKFLTVVLCVLLPGLVFVSASPSAPPDGLFLLCELISAFWVLLLGLHCFFTEGFQALLRKFIHGAMFAALVESAGIDMGFFSEPGYSLYLPFTQTPAVAVTGWLTVFYPVLWLARGLVPPSHKNASLVTFVVRNVFLAAIPASLAVLSDLHLDPIAVRLKLWIWHADLQPFFLGVPFVNFSGWFSAVYSFSLLVLVGERFPGWKGIGSMIAGIPAAQGLAGFLNFTLVWIFTGGSVEFRLLADALQRALGR